MYSLTRLIHQIEAKTYGWLIRTNKQVGATESTYYYFANVWNEDFDWTNGKGGKCFRAYANTPIAALRLAYKGLEEELKS